MPFIELYEHTERPSVAARRFLVNTDRISYVAALNSNDHAILVFDDRTRAIVVDETWAEVLGLLESTT